jgi:hypothetical protein
MESALFWVAVALLFNFEMYAIYSAESVTPVLRVVQTQYYLIICVVFSPHVFGARFKRTAGSVNWHR